MYLAATCVVHVPSLLSRIPARMSAHPSVSSTSNTNQQPRQHPDMTNPAHNPLLNSMLQADQAQAMMNQTMEAVFVPTLQGFVSSIYSNQQLVLQNSIQHIAGLGLFSRCQFVPKKAGFLPCTSVAARGSNYCQKHKYRCELEDLVKEESRKRKRAEDCYVRRGGSREELENAEESDRLTKKPRTNSSGPTVELAPSPPSSSKPRTSAQPLPPMITPPQPTQPMPSGWTPPPTPASPTDEIIRTIEKMTVDDATAHTGEAANTGEEWSG